MEKLIDCINESFQVNESTLPSKKLTILKEIWYDSTKDHEDREWTSDKPRKFKMNEKPATLTFLEIDEDPIDSDNDNFIYVSSNKKEVYFTKHDIDNLLKQKAIKLN